MLVCRGGFSWSGDVFSFFPLARGGGLQNVQATDSEDFASPVPSAIADPATSRVREHPSACSDPWIRFLDRRRSRYVNTTPTSGAAQRFMVIRAPVPRAARAAAVLRRLSHERQTNSNEMRSTSRADTSRNDRLRRDAQGVALGDPLTRNGY